VVGCHQVLKNRVWNKGQTKHYAWPSSAAVVNNSEMLKLPISTIIATKKPNNTTKTIRAKVRVDNKSSNECPTEG